MVTLSLFQVAAVVLGIAAAFGYLNHRWLRMPQTIGLVVIALAASLVVIALDALAPGLGFQTAVRGALSKIDFHETLMKGMLGFLLFAGALHVDLSDLYSRRYAIGTLATAGVLISTLLVGFATFGMVRLAGLPVPLVWCLVFGALISPTDPIAVLGILKIVKVPRPLEAMVAGESLFNDGVGVVVFTLLATLAAGSEGGGSVTTAGVVRFFVLEIIGGSFLGLAAGWVAYRAMKTIDEHNLEVLITLALVMLTYSVAVLFHASGPIAVVVAGLLIGNHGTQFAMSETTRDHVHKFWSLVDEILNAALFLLIGFEIVAISITGEVALLMAAAVPIVLAARLLSVAMPIGILGLRRTFTRGTIPVLTWGGVRGGISVALVLSLPAGPLREVLLAATYGVVIFSIIVQGLTVERLVRRVVG